VLENKKGGELGSSQELHDDFHPKRAISFLPTLLE
jgi:hypothetical protein